MKRGSWEIGLSFEMVGGRGCGDGDVAIVISLLDDESEGGYKDANVRKKKV